MDPCNRRNPQLQAKARSVGIHFRSRHCGSTVIYRLRELRIVSLNLTVLLLLVSITTGCGLNTAILKTGGNGRTGVLLNYSCGAHPCEAINPSKPTIVVTHGWNPLPNMVRTTFGSASADAIKCRYGDRFNLLSWDWNAVRVSPFNDHPLTVSRCQGQMLASALRARGINPSATHMIGHSLGAIIMTQAAVCLSDLGPMAQLTLLEPPRIMHEEVFDRLGATQHAYVVENYWAPRLSGYGAPVEHYGVYNYEIPGPTPIRGIVDLSVSNHVNVMRWYHQTICNPTMQYGFQNSVLLSH